MATYPERYDHIDFSVPEGVQDAFQRGLDLVAEGFGGDGLEDQTLREARSLAAGEEPTVDKIRKMYRFWARNERFLDADDKTSPSWVSAMLWGGRPGMAWCRSLVEQMDAADRGEGVDSARVNNARADVRRLPVIYPRGKMIKHGAGDFEVTQEFIDQQLHAFAFMRDEYGYYPPILQQHEEDGFTFGLVTDLIESEAGISPEVQFAKGYAQRYDDGLMTHWSPAHYPEFQPSDSDRVFYNVLAELSFVALPHMLDVTAPSAHYDLPVRMSRAELAAQCQAQQTGEREMEELEALRALLDEKFDELSSRLDALEADEEEAETADNAGDGEEVEMEKKDNEGQVQNAAAIEHQRELVKMSREIAELKRERAKDQIRLSAPDLKDEDVEMLVSMSAEQRAYTLGIMQQARTASSQQQVSTPAGASSTLPAGQFRTMCERAKKNGATASNLLTHLMSREGVTLDQYSTLYDEPTFRDVFGV